MTEEMKKALEADGEKLRQLTGEDHGPWEVVGWPCPSCNGNTRLDDSYLMCDHCERVVGFVTYNRKPQQC